MTEQPTYTDLPRWFVEPKITDGVIRFQIRLSSVEAFRKTKAFTKVRALIEAGRPSGKTLVLDTADPKVLARLEAALAAAATETGESRLFGRLAYMAGTQRARLAAAPSAKPKKKARAKAS